MMITSSARKRVNRHFGMKSVEMGGKSTQHGEDEKFAILLR